MATTTKITRIGFKGSSFRAQPGQVVTHEHIQRYAPSILAEDKHCSRSERYQFIPTGELIYQLSQLGFYPTEVAQGGSRIEGKREFTKHMVRLGHPKLKSLDGTRLEALIYNAHDGTSSWTLWLGGIRFVCLNGHVFGEEVFSARVSHTSRNAIDLVGEALSRAIAAGDTALAAIDRMQTTMLTEEQSRVLAEHAIDMRFEDSIANTGIVPVVAEQVLVVRRQEDAAPSVWNVYNRIQESLVRGGIHYTTTDRNNRRRHGTTRAVSSVDGNRTLNQRLFALATAFEALASGRKNALDFAV